MKERVIWILWPAFIVAMPAVGIVFSVLDPAEVHIAGTPVELSRMASYTLGFLFFWGLGACSSALSTLLQRSPFEINRCPLRPDQRPEACPRP